ncbi:MAG: L-histidine N(alpha)-methyltransferase [Candidatus Eremiobacteraeota bacterium]|nr:L-histidine N(alpha)-methyltransferase [Candidatus Eremiobacteraeota bacterium]
MQAISTALSDRLEIIAVEPTRSASFADDVRAGLCASKKHLPSKYFYDELGSAIFESITVLPEYYLTRAETEILRDSGWEIVRAIGHPVEFLELGSGSAVKTRLLIDEAIRAQGRLHYSAIEISPEALRRSALALVDAYPTVTVTGYAADYFAVLGAPELKFKERVLAMFMGSNIGNYEPARAAALLERVGASLRAGDALLIGADLKKDPKTLELAYNDPAGVTASFNKNVLGRINRELGGTFDLVAFDHIAAYDASRGVVESFLESRSAQCVQIAALGSSIDFAAGERIHTESSYKFSVEDIARIGAHAGFGLQRSWFDSERRFSVNLLTKQ